MHANFLLGLGPVVATLFAFQGPAPQDPEVDGPKSAYFELQRELESWRAEHGESWRAEYEAHTGFARLLWGGQARAAFAPRAEADLEPLARAALAATRALHGVDPETLVLDRITFLPLALAGSSDKYGVRLTQVLGGVPVAASSVNLLFSARGELLALDAQALTGVSSFLTSPALSAGEALARAEDLFAQASGVAPAVADAPQVRVTQVLEGKFRAPRLAWEVGLRAGGGALAPQGWRFTLDAHSGAELARANTVQHFDVSGQVRSMTTPGLAADIASNPETSQPMPYLRVTSAQGNALTDAGGNFTIPGATAPLAVTLVFEGTWAATNNDPGADYSLGANLASASGNVVVMNPAGATTVTAEANAFQWIGRMRDWTRAVNPSDSASDFLAPANVNLAQTCNAYYDGLSVNFFAAGGSCPNTAFSTIVLHEMGHWLNDRYGSGNGADGFGEGNADVFSMYMVDDPIVGLGFCGTGCNVRDGNNTRQFCGDGNGGCYGEVHADGEVLMGALWKVRTRLENALGASAGGLAADTLFNAWMNAFDDSQIQSIIEIHWLTLDDDDGNIDNGTPNYSPIDLGFREQGFPGFDLPNLSIGNLTELPDTLDETGPYAVSVDIVAQFFPPVAVPTLHWRRNGGAWSTQALLATGGSGYTGDIPGQLSPAKIEYYVSAQDAQTNSGVHPAGAPAGAAFFLIGVKTILFSEGFEGGAAGWTHGQIATQDDWQRSADAGLAGAAGESGDPSAAFTGTNIWGNDLGAGTWNGAYGDNVHNWLRSPALDFTGQVGTTLRFRRWLTIEKGIYDQARVLVDGSEVWVNPAGTDMLDTAWNLTEVDISGAADGKSGVQIEFRLQSDGGVVFGGWNLDDIEVLTLEAACAQPTATAPLAQSVCPGSPAVFSTSAGGSGPFSHQWRKNGIPIGGATAALYSLASAQAGDAGAYSVEVTGACGSVLTPAATLTVFAPVTASAPTNAAVCAGAAAAFSTTAGGTGPFTYQWEQNGAPIAGATAASHAIPSTTLGDAGSYTVVVAGACGSVESAAATLTVNSAPGASTPASATVCAGSPANFSTTASGTGPFGYQWKQDGNPIAGATTSSHSIAAAAASDAGSYSVVVTGACGALESGAATLVVNSALSASAPAGQQVCVGSPAVFSTVAGGTGPFAYQWKQNGNPIPGATLSSLSIPSVTAADAGSYSVAVSAACGALETPSASLVVSGVSTTYCTAKLSSSLCLPSIAAAGTPSLGSPGLFTVQTTQLETTVSAIDFFGTTGQAALPFQGGLMCVASPIFRLSGKASGGAGTCAGSVAYSLADVLANAGGINVIAGGSLYLQTWSRDLGDAFGSSLSNAVQTVVCP